MSFWTQNKFEPIRKYRFQIQTPLSSVTPGIWWWAKTVEKPSYEVSTNEYQLINHKFKFPGVLTWNDISITIVDFVGGKKLLHASKATQLMANLGVTYSPPGSQINRDQFAKKPLHQGYSISKMEIEQLGANGKAVEKWTLHDAFVKSVNFGTLAYADDELQEITIGLSYDFATFGDNKSQGEDTQKQVAETPGTVPALPVATSDGSGGQISSIGDATPELQQQFQNLNPGLNNVTIEQNTEAPTGAGNLIG